MGTTGLFFIVGAITGRLRFWRGQRADSLGDYQDMQSAKPSPLAVRMANSITELLPVGRFGLGEVPIEVQLIRAGNPYDSPTHFYQRKVAFMGLYAVGGTILGVLAGLPAPLILLFVLIAGVMGLVSPESVIADKIKKRSDLLHR